jgi:hypothetical protein
MNRESEDWPKQKSRKEDLQRLEGVNRYTVLSHTTNFLTAPSMTFRVTADAKRNQVGHHIAIEPAPSFYVMDLQAFHVTALLAAPTVSFQDQIFGQFCILPGSI